MFKALTIISLLAAGPALAQMDAAMPHNPNSVAGMMPMNDSAMPMDGSAMSMENMAGNANTGIGGSPLFEPGQSAFAAIAEVVRALKANPETDWAKVDIDALREHLRDMDVVTIDSTTETRIVGDSFEFTITGSPEISNSIARMVLGHANIMDGVDGWEYRAEALNAGALLVVTPPAADFEQLRGLGFYGLLASGMHHQPHHWMMANGQGMGG